MTVPADAVPPASAGPGRETRPAASPARLRVGVVLVLLWWIPVWLGAPIIAAITGFDTRDVLIAMIVVQTVIGLAGVLVVGTQVTRIVSGVPARRMLPTVWSVLRRGAL